MTALSGFKSFYFFIHHYEDCHSCSDSRGGRTCLDGRLVVRSRYMQTAKQTLTVIFFVFNCWSLTELVVLLFLLNFYQPTQYSCSYTLKPNHLYSRNRNRGSISSWHRLFNRNENLRLSLTRYLAIASLCERLKHLVLRAGFSVKWKVHASDTHYHTVPREPNTTSSGSVTTPARSVT